MLLIFVSLYSDTKHCERLEPGEGKQERVVYYTSISEENKGVLPRWFPCSIYFLGGIRNTSAGDRNGKVS